MKRAFLILLLLSVSVQGAEFNPPLATLYSATENRMGLVYFYGIPDGARVYYEDTEVTDRTYRGLPYRYFYRIRPWQDISALFEVRRGSTRYFRWVSFRADDTRHVHFDEFVQGTEAPLSNTTAPSFYTPRLNLFPVEFFAGSDLQIDLSQLTSQSGPFSLVDLPDWARFDGRKQLVLSPGSSETGSFLLRGVLGPERGSTAKGTPFYLRVLVKPPSAQRGPLSDVGTIGRGRVVLRVALGTLVTVNDIPSAQSGEVQEFETQGLRVGEKGRVKIKLDYRNQNGRQVARTQTFELAAGRTLDLSIEDFFEKTAL